MTETMPYDEAVASFDPVLGIEVHVELGTATKMFDAAAVTFGAEPNTETAFVMLRKAEKPSTNSACIRMTRHGSSVRDCRSFWSAMSLGNSLPRMITGPRMCTFAFLAKAPPRVRMSVFRSKRMDLFARVATRKVARFHIPPRQAKLPIAHPNTVDSPL